MTAVTRCIAWSRPRGRIPMEHAGHHLTPARGIVPAWTTAGAALGAMLGAATGTAVVIAMGLWVAVPWAAWVGAVVGGILGSVVGAVDGLVLAGLSRTTFLVPGTPAHPGRVRCVATATTGAASAMLGMLLFGADQGTPAALLTILPPAVGMAAALRLSGRLPPVQPQRGQQHLV